jgi:hypothetical protein
MENLTLERVGNTLTNRERPTQKFKICERRKTTPSKANSFLLQKEPEERYISSLWPTDASGNVFEFESGGRRFVLTLETSKAEIRTKGGNGHV